MKVWNVFAIILACIVSRVMSDLVSEEHRLHEYLMNETRYNKFQRPVKNITHPVVIKFGIALIQLYELDERSEHISAHVWIRQLWRDAYLTWKPEDFGGVTTLRIPSDAVWKPDLTLYNGVGELKPHDALAVVYNSGDILHIPAATIVAMCPMDLTKFPFDEQTCFFKFGSWAYNGFQIDLDLYEGQDNVDLSDHVGSKSWEVVDTSAKVNRKYYPCCEEPYPDIRFNLTLRRKTTYYHYVFVTPAVMLALLCPVLFVLPSDDTGKFTFGGTLLVTMAILYIMLEEQLPRSHNTVPVIGVYYSVVFVLTSLSLAVSAVTNNMANRATRFSHPPAVLKTVLLICLGRVVCVSYDSTYGVESSGVALHDTSGDKQEGAQGTQIPEWRLMARVLDRVFFILFLIVVVLTTLVLLA